MQYTERDFYLLQQKADQQWWLGIALAVGVHATVCLLLFFSPSLFVTEPIVEEVVSVSLVAMPEVGGAPAPPAAAAPAAAKPAKPAAEKEPAPAPAPEPAPPPPPPPPKPAPAPEPVAPPADLAPTPKEKVAVQPEPTVPEPVALKNPISLAPDKRKIKKTQDTRLEEEKVHEQREREERELQKKLEERKKEAEQRKQEERELQKKLEERQLEADKKAALKKEEARQKALAQARLEQIKAENEARAAASEARDLAAQANAAAAAAAAVRADASRKSQAMQSAVTGGSSGRQQAQSIVEQTYWGAVAQRVKKYWALPETSRWDGDLLAKVVITINKNGDVTSIRFDQRSKDPRFDQLVEKTIKSASPMPHFPALMQQDTTEVGFKFRPGELGNM